MKSRTSSAHYWRRIDYERFCVRDESLQTLFSDSESTTGNIKPLLMREPVKFQCFEAVKEVFPFRSQMSALGFPGLRILFSRYQQTMCAQN